MSNTNSIFEYRQWILRDENKRPINPETLKPFPDGSNWLYTPELWVSYDEAYAIQKTCPGFFTGFVFTVSDPFWFLDIDKCGANGEWSNTANELMNLFTGAYIEVSQSGNGLHIIGSGECPPHACKNTELGIEFYTEKRFVALTGTHARGDSSKVFNGELVTLVNNYFLPPFVTTSIEWTDKPVAEYSLLTDDETIEKALKSKSAGSTFGGKASFADLWNCDTEALAEAYTPDSSDKGA